jgi:hypothetical protein
MDLVLNVIKLASLVKLNKNVLAVGLMLLLIMGLAFVMMGLEKMRKMEVVRVVKRNVMFVKKIFLFVKVVRMDMD